MSTANRPLAGIFWMFVTGLCFVAVTALVKWLDGRIPAAQAGHLRFVLGLLFLIPMIPAFRQVKLTKRLWALFATRGAFHTVAVVLWFFAMSQIPIAEVTAMNYMAPIYVTIGAALLLGERFAWRRMLAVAAALIGALIILRPGFRELDPGHIAMVFCALSFAGAYLIAKLLAGEIPAGVVVVMMSLFVTVFLTPFSIAVWVWPTWTELGILFLVASFATGGHYAMTLAFAAAPVAVTQPVTFLQLVWATLLGALVFGEAVDAWVIGGGVLILAAVGYISIREAQLRKAAITPPQPATKI